MKTDIKTTPTPKQCWLDLRARILAEIKEIDEITPWQSSEPKWWLDMAAVRSLTISTAQE